MVDRTSSIGHEHVRIAITDVARPGYENVPAQLTQGGNWQLLRSPLYATQVAAGDVVKVLNSETGEFKIISRGGNVCVQFYLCPRDSDNPQLTNQVAIGIAADIAALGGRLDGQTPGLISFTIPIAAGFPAIEQAFSAAVDRNPGAQWQYSNVYTKTGEPLGWWNL